MSSSNEQNECSDTQSQSEESAIDPPTVLMHEEGTGPVESKDNVEDDVSFAKITREMREASFVSTSAVASTCVSKIWCEPSMKRIFDNNRAWSKEILSRDPDHFKKLAKGQKPRYLLIGCSDSRVPAEAILGLGLGEVFIHRNVANVCVNTDMNFLSVLSYAVEHLGIQDIIVLGHYGCGGVKAALDNHDHGLLAHWLRNIRDIRRMHQDELKGIDDPQKLHDRMVEINVQEQCMNMYTNEIVQAARAKNGYPHVRGMIYNVEDGLLKMLGIDFNKEVDKYKEIFNAYEMKHSLDELQHSFDDVEGTEL